MNKIKRLKVRPIRPGEQHHAHHHRNIFHGASSLLTFHILHVLITENNKYTFFKCLIAKINLVHFLLKYLSFSLI